MGDPTTQRGHPLDVRWIVPAEQCVVKLQVPEAVAIRGVKDVGSIDLDTATLGAHKSGSTQKYPT